MAVSNDSGIEVTPSGDSPRHYAEGKPTEAAENPRRSKTETRADDNIENGEAAAGGRPTMGSEHKNDDTPADTKAKVVKSHKKGDKSEHRGKVAPDISVRLLQRKIKSINASAAKDRKSLCACSGATCKNIRVFVAIYSLLFLFRAILREYLTDVISGLHRRYLIREMELELAVGMEKVGFIVLLLIVAYYGNKMHKPLAIFVGSMFCASGSILCCAPYFLEGPRNEDLNSDGLPVYFQAGLCQTDLNVTLAVSQCDALVGSRGEVLSGGNGDIPGDWSGREAVVALLLCGNLIVGVGTALLASLGFVYIEEQTEAATASFYYGVVLCMNGVGELVGALAAWWLTTGLTEDLQLYGLSLRGWDPGAWWVVFPVLCGLFLLVPFPLLLFPKWVTEPQWLQFRRKRRLRRLQRHLAEETKRLKRDQLRRKRRKKRREREEKAKKAEEEAEAAQRDAEGEGGAGFSGAALVGDVGMVTDPTGGFVNPVFAHQEEDRDVEVAENAGDGDDGDGDDGDGEEEAEEEEVDKGNDTTAATSAASVTVDTVVNGDAKASDDVIVDTEEVMNEDNMLPKNVRFSMEADDVTAAATADDIAIVSRDFTREEDSLSEKSDKSDKSKAEQKRLMLGRQLQDMPRNLWFLLCNPIFTVGSLGMALASLLPGGYRPSMTRYINAQYPQRDPPPYVLAALPHSMAVALGCLLGGIIILRRKLKVSDQIRMVVILTALSTALMLIQMALVCPDDGSLAGLPGGASSPDPDLDCSIRCDCSDVELAPVCGAGGGRRFLTPCQAGCSGVRYDPGLRAMVYDECKCAEGTLSAALCGDRCPMLAAHSVVTFLAVLCHSMGQPAMVTLFLRAVSQKLRSLSLGFAIWIVYLVAFVPGYAIFETFYNLSCLLYQPNCFGESICWYYDTSLYRYLHNGAAAASLLLALVCFAAVWRVITSRAARKLKMAGRDAAESNANDTVTEHEPTSVVTTEPTGISS